MKKSLIVISFCFTFSFARDNYPRQPGFDVLHYRIHIQLNDTNDSIEAKTEIVFLATPSVSKRISFDLSGLTVVGVQENNEPAQFECEEEKLRVILRQSSRAGDTCRVVIQYRGKPADGLIIGKNKFGHRTFFADNWPNRAHFWFPSIDHPYDKATVEFMITAPSHYDIVATGSLRETTSTLQGGKLWHWTTSVPIPTYCMVFGAAEFSVVNRDSWNSIPVTNYLYPADSTKGLTDFAYGTRILEYYSKLIGPYPYEKLALVQSTTRFGGMENAGNIFFAERAFNGSGRLTGTVAHEIAHQWFGDAVTEADWHHLWLSEGFASYFGPLYFEHLFGRDTLVSLMLRGKNSYLRSSVANLPICDTTVTDFMKLLNANNYEKGSWVLHMLRGLMGDDKFFGGIREYYRTFQNNTAMTEDLQVVMEKHAKQNLDWFFRQWIYGAGHPKLDVVWKWDDRAKEVKLQITQTQEGVVFRLPMEVEIRSGDSKQLEKVAVVQKEQSFSFKLKAKPTGVTLDPNEWVLKELLIHGE